MQLSSGWDQPMGSLVVPVREMLAEPQLILDQWFHLDGASPESQILLRAELKVLNTPTGMFFYSIKQQQINNNTCSSHPVFAFNRF